MLSPLTDSLRPHSAEILFGEQNAHILRSIETVRRALDFLIRNQFTVLRVTAAGRNPVIEIQHATRCVDIHGAVKYRTPKKTVWAALIEGCQVEWCQS